MKRLALASLLLSLVVCWVVVADGPGGPKPPDVKLNGHAFTLPPGFEIELIAGPPLVNRPITADFDDDGRLYVADSSGSNEKVDVQLQKKPHRVVRLEDSDGDGKFDKSTVFAEGMMFPEGTMWLDGSLYVAAPPSIWKLTDTDGDGVADKREEWFKGRTLTGCANDLHGPYRGPDGWVYWCKGAFAKQTYPSPQPLSPQGRGAGGEGGKKPFETRAAHVFRCRPDGGGLEPVMTGGMDNPVDVVFTPGGERVFTTTFFQHPGGGQRDGLVHAVYGGVYGKVHDPIFDPAHKWTGPQVMPVLTHMGAAAPAGLTRYESSAFGEEYRDNLFACQFNMHKVSRHVLAPAGATFATRDEDFVVSANLDFHPTDVIEDADGSLIVVDTGGWYKLCCPTSQLVKPDVLGGIYRVRKKGAPRVEDPRGRKLAWVTMTAKELVALLDDPRPVVRRRAVQALAAKGVDAVPLLAEAVRSGRSVEARRNAMWAATRLDGTEARAAVRAALADSDETVRQAALHSISLWRDREAVPALIGLLTASSSHNRRGAAEALGRIGDKAAVPALLGALAATDDRFLEHSLTYALIEIADRDATAAGLKSANASVRRATLTALDQMDGGGLTADVVAPHLVSPDAATRETASWIAGRHPEWGGALAGFFRNRLSAKGLTPAERDDLAGLLAHFARADAVRDLLADELMVARSKATSRVVLRAMAASGLKEAPRRWVVGLVHALAAGDEELSRAAVAAARAVPPAKDDGRALTAGLLKLGGRESVPDDVRLGALAAVPGGVAVVTPPLFDYLRDRLDREQPVATRGVAAEVVAKAKLTPDQLLALTASFKNVGPMEADRLIDAFAQTTDERVGLSLVEALATSSARSGLRVDALKPRLAKYGPKVAAEAEKLYALLDANAARQKAKLEELLASMRGGDVRRGQAVFNGPKAACASCHAIGYLGGKVGPDLTRVGQIRTERDLLESIVFPSASFVRSYEPVQVTTKAGKTLNGLIRKDAPEEIILATNATEEVRIARGDVEEIVPGKVSIMPAGLDQQLTVSELADLVAFLRACK